MKIERMNATGLLFFFVGLLIAFPIDYYFADGMLFMYLATIIPAYLFYLIVQRIIKAFFYGNIRILNATSCLASYFILSYLVAYWLAYEMHTAFDEPMKILYTQSLLAFSLQFIIIGAYQVFFAYNGSFKEDNTKDE